MRRAGRAVPRTTTQGGGLNFFFLFLLSHVRLHVCHAHRQRRDAPWMQACDHGLGTCAVHAGVWATAPSEPPGRPAGAAAPPRPGAKRTAASGSPGSPGKQRPGRGGRRPMVEPPPRAPDHRDGGCRNAWAEAVVRGGTGPRRPPIRVDRQPSTPLPQLGMTASCGRRGGRQPL